MFTGIVEDVGEVRSSRIDGGDICLKIAPGSLDISAIKIGDSIAVNGACLTVVSAEGAELEFDVSRESLANTTISSWKKGTRVNLEQAMLPTTRLGGHFVSGHVDGISAVVSIHKDARSSRILVQCPEGLRKFVARKGSVTLDGVSLTVNKVSEDGFGVNIVPHTLEATTLGQRVPGNKLNIEVDLVARYIDRILDSESQDTGQNSTKNLQQALASSGFI